MDDASPPPYVAVTGMVGVGKSTLARALADELGWALMTETVNEEDNPWLAPYYAHEDERPNPYALPLQHYFLLDRADQIRAMTRAGEPFLADQAMEVDAGVFIRGHRADGVLSEPAFDLLWRTFENLRAADGVKRPDLLVRLTAPFELVLDRIRSRGRPSELAVSPDYWRRLHERFEQPIPGCEGIAELTLDVRTYDVKAGAEDVRRLVSRVEDRLGARAA